MPRFYKRRTQRPELDKNKISAAINDVLKGKSYRETVIAHGIKLSTLHFYVKKYKKAHDVRLLDNDDSGQEDIPDPETLVACSSRGRFRARQIFTDKQEQLLLNYIIQSSRICFGLSKIQCRELAYEFAIKNKLKLPKKWDTEKLAGVEWLKSFRNRHPELSLRKPENTSIARASAFNKENVGVFFSNFKAVMDKHLFAPERILNLDETGVTTVLQSPKVLAKRGKRQVGQIVSAERGELVTFVGIINAVGNAFPPVFVFPRVRYKDSFINGAPAGSLGLSSRNGWMVAELFVDVLKHILKHTQCTPTNPILLLLDNHCSHISIESISFAKQHGIVVLSFPPHCSHRLQPLDVSVYNPFKGSLKTAMNNHMLSHPGKPISIYDLPAICKIAFSQAFSINNIQSGFSKAGIWPLNELIFSEDDYAAAYVTDRPIQDASKPADPIGNEDAKNMIELNLQMFTPEMVRPFPKAQPRKATLTKRAKVKSTIYTDTPVKRLMEEKRAQKKKPMAQSSKSTKVVPVTSDSDSDSSTETEMVLESESDVGIETESEDENKGPAFKRNVLDSDTLKVGDFILVKFPQKCSYTDVFYVGEIIKLYNQQDFDVKYLRKNGIHFVFPLIDDVAQVSRQDVMMLLDKPIAVKGTNRVSAMMNFTENLNRFNVR